MDGVLGATVYAGLFLIYGRKDNPRWWSIWAARGMSAIGALLLLVHLATGILSGLPAVFLLAWIVLTVCVALGEFYLLDRWVALWVTLSALALFLLWAVVTGHG